MATTTHRPSPSSDLDKAVAFFSGAEMPARVWGRKYRLRDKTDSFLEDSPLQTFCRMADAVSAPPDSTLRRNLVDRRFIPAGRMLFALGNPYFRACVKNCFVLLPRDDSLEAISDLRKEMARTYAMGGGVGIDISRLRPAGAPVNNSALTSSGAASFADGFSHLTGEIGQCIPVDEFVMTPSGWREIGSLSIGDDIWTHEGVKKITHLFERQVRSCLQIRTRRGFTVRTSVDHKLARVVNGDLVAVAANEISTGDQVLILRGDSPTHVRDHSPVKLSSIIYQRSAHNNSNRLKVIEQPPVLNEGLAWLLGFYMANGSTEASKQGDLGYLSFSSHCEFTEVHNKCEQTIRRLFGISASVVDRDGEQTTDITVSSKFLCRWFAANGFIKDGSPNAFVPNQIFDSPPNVQAAFIGGYFDGDGTNGNDKKGFAITSVSSRAIDGLRRLYLSLGIVTSTSTEKRDEKGWKDLHSLAVVGRSAQELFHQHVSEHSVRANDWVAKRDSAISPWTHREVPQKVSAQNYVPDASHCLSVSCLNRLVDDFDIERSWTRLVQDEIVSISTIGEHETVDIEVDHGFWFAPGGLLTHNSGRRGALMISISVDHPDVQRFIQTKNDFPHEMGEQLRERLPQKLFKRLVEEVIDPRRTCGNSNMSVRITDRFMSAVKEGRPHVTRFVMDNGQIIEKVFDARKLWDEIITGAWSHGCPGVMFWDTAEREDNRTYLDERWKVVTTNPCVTGDTRLATQHGLVKIEDLHISQSDLICTVDRRALDDDEDGVTTRPAVPAFVTDENADVWAVTTKDGFTIKATSWHDFYTTHGKIKLKDLAVGDDLLIQSGKGQFGQEGSYKLGFVMGLVAGDGCISRRKPNEEATHIALWGEDKRFAPFVVEAVNEMIVGNYPRARAVGAPALPKADAVRVSSSVLTKHLAGYGFTKKTKLQVPEVVWRGNEDCVQGYLHGLFQADGTVNICGHKRNKSCSIRLSSSSKPFLQEVQVLLANFGLLPRIYKRREAGKRLLPDGKGGKALYDCQANYELVLDGASRDGFMAEIGFADDGPKAQKIARWNAGRTRRTYRQKRVSKIESITYAGKHRVFDTTQEDHNTVIFNGIVTGQCGEMLLSDGGSCNLGAINLARFTTDPYSSKAEFDWSAFKQAIRDGIDFLDSVNDIELREDRAPLKKQAEVTEGLRQVGLGIMGYGDLLLQHQIRYASEDALGFTDKLFRCLRDTAYHQSIMRAKEFGPFPSYDWEKIKRSPFIDRLPAEIKKLMEKHGLRNSNVLSIAPTGCLEPGTLVTTNRGLVRIEMLGDVDGDQWQDISLKVPHRSGATDATKFFINGVADTVRIETRCGYRMRGTLKHRVKIVDQESYEWEWRRLDELEEGDIVPIQIGTMVGEPRHVDLPILPKAYHPSHKCRAPSEMNVDLAELVGFFMANGSLHRTGIRLCVDGHDRDVVDHLVENSILLFGGIEPRVRDCGGYFEVKIGTIQLVRWWRAAGFAKIPPSEDHKGKGYNAYVPDTILATNDQQIYAAFLRGMFEADGTHDVGLPRLSNKDRQLISDVKTMMMIMGFPTSLKHDIGGKSGKSVWGCRLLNTSFAARWVEEIGFIGKRKQAKTKVERRRLPIGDYIPLSREILDLAFRDEPYKKRKALLSWNKRGSVHRELLKDCPFREIQTLLGYFYDEVVSAESAGFVETYDISVPDGNTYIANGFVSHNTIAIMGETTSGIEPEFAFQLTRACNLGDGKRTKFTYLTPTARRIAAALGKSVPQGEIEGRVDMSWLPEWAVAAHQIDPLARARVQGLIQQFIDVSISSTVNLPETATIDDVKTVYMAAYEAGCKGITIYREGSRGGVLETLSETERLEYPIEPPLQIKSRRISFKGENGLQRILINVGDYRPGVPCEVSVIHGKSGTEVASYASALGIMISIALQNGVDPNKIARAMEGISAGWATRLKLDGKGQKSTMVQSVPDAVAAVLKKFYGNGIYEKGVLGQPINGAVNKIGWELTSEERKIARRCKKCHKQTYIPDGSCWKCINPACDVDGICG